MSNWLRLLLIAGVAASTIAAANHSGYLDTPVDLTAILPPPPARGDIRYRADRRMFKATRPMLATARGRLATSDVPSSVVAVMKDFSCAAGVRLSPETTPATYRLLANAGADTARANNAAKEYWRRLRPFLIDKGPSASPGRNSPGASIIRPATAPAAGHLG